MTAEDARLTFTLHEYGKVKDELLASITSQHTTMTYGLTAAAAIFTGLLTTWDNIDIRLSILSLAPIFLSFVWFIWLGEVTRMARAARFLWDLEKRVNVDLCPARSSSPAAPALHWESWVRGENQWRQNLLLGPSYAISSAVLLGMAVISSALAVALFLFEHTSEAWLSGLVFGAAACTAALIFIGGLTIRRNPLLRRGQTE